MADIIKIKNSTVTAAPASLAASEVAYSELSGNLMIGRISDGVPVVIGGKTDHDKLAGIQAGAEVNAVDTVAGRTGDVVVTTSDLADFNTAADARIGLKSIDYLADVDTTTVAPTDGQVLTWDNANSKWEPAAPGTGVTTFLALNDTPASFATKGSYFVRVNAAENALEFTANVIDGGTY